LPVIARLLELIPKDSTEKRRAFDESLGAIIHALWDMRETQQSASQLIRFNPLEDTACPQVSIIIPIYGRYDFIEYQLAQFANDDFMHKQEIIYVIDDPRICEQVKSSCETLARIYKIPFNLLLLESNLGYAGANNAGVSHANGSNVLLLNSDVFPQSHGWLEQLLASVDYDLSELLLGARLTYHDESIQHDGMSFFSSPFAGGLWINMHPGKGLPSDQFSCSTRLQKKECITGACLLISKDNYETLGGLDESFILGDFEDSDLCMKARDKGLRILLSEQVCLYHLERQSQSLVSGSRWKNELTFYNCWYHTNKWHSQITQLKKDMPSEHLH
jgi:GT2 family glycosyltransferase